MASLFKPFIVEILVIAFLTFCWVIQMVTGRDIQNESKGKHFAVQFLIVLFASVAALGIVDFLKQKISFTNNPLAIGSELGDVAEAMAVSEPKPDNIVGSPTQNTERLNQHVELAVKRALEIAREVENMERAQELERAVRRALEKERATQNSPEFEGDMKNEDLSSSSGSFYTFDEKVGIPSSIISDLATVLEGEWESRQWQYAFRIAGDIGVATMTNAPSAYGVGDIMLIVKSYDQGIFKGRQIYTNGVWYDVSIQRVGDVLEMKGPQHTWVMTRK